MAAARHSTAVDAELTINWSTGNNDAGILAIMSTESSRPDGAASDDSGATRVLVLSTTAFTLLFAVWLMFGVLAVPIKEQLHLNKIQFSWLTAIGVLSGSIWRLPVGIFTDRVGGRRLFVALLIATAIPCFLVSRATSYAGLMTCAFFFGVAGNSFSVGIAWNAAWASRQRQGVALGTFGAGNVGASVTKLIGPALITLVPAAGLLGGALPGGWRIVPVLYSALLLVMAAAVWLWAPSDRFARPARDARCARCWRHCARSASGVSASTTSRCSAPTWRSRFGCRATTSPSIT